MVGPVNFLKELNLSARIGLFIVFSMGVCGIFAPWLAPYSESQIVGDVWEPIGGKFIFGTDQIGRDVFSRMIYGTRNTVGIAVLTTILSFLIGGALGLAAAIDRRWLDQFLSRSVDVLMAIPSLIFALVLLSIFGSTILNLIIIIP